MNKPISLSLVDDSHKILAASLSCSFESHLVEDPLICNNPLCQALMCRSCLNSKIEKKCPKCQTFNYYFNSDIPLILKNQLNQIYLKCENHLLRNQQILPKEVHDIQKLILIVFLLLL